MLLLLLTIVLCMVAGICYYVFQNNTNDNTINARNDLPTAEKLEEFTNRLKKLWFEIPLNIDVSIKDFKCRMITKDLKMLLICRDFRHPVKYVQFEYEYDC